MTLLQAKNASESTEMQSDCNSPTAARQLRAAVMGAIYRWDAATGKALTPESAGDSIVEQILVTSDGTRVITRGQDGDAHIWDAANGNHLRGFKAAWERGMAMSPDGKYLVWASADPSIKFHNPQHPRNWTTTGTRIRMYDMAGDKFVERFAGCEGEAHDITFSNDGKKIIAIDHDNGMVRLWNVESGKEERSFQAVPEAEKNQAYHVRRTMLSPDGKTLAVGYDDDAANRPGFGHGPHMVRLWDLSAEKELFQLEGHYYYILDLVFSPDGRFLATASATESKKRSEEVFVWEMATGKRVEALPAGLPGATAVAFSRDGRLFATAQPEGEIQLWETATWTMLTTFKGHRDRPTALTFSPNGHLLSGSLDTTVLAWDVRPPRSLTGSLETAWIALANPEGGEAFKAAGRFVAQPSESIKFFEEKLKPREDPDAKRMLQWIADLDSDKFPVREAASKALRDLGSKAKPFLEEAVKTTKSPEVLERTGSSSRELTKFLLSNSGKRGR